MLRIKLARALRNPSILATLDGAVLPAGTPPRIETAEPSGEGYFVTFKGGAAPGLLRLYAPAPVPEMTWEDFKAVPAGEWEGVVEDGFATDGVHLACDGSPHGMARLAAALERGAYREYCDCTPLSCAASFSFERWRRDLKWTKRAPGLVAMVHRMSLKTAHKALATRGFRAFAEGGSVQMAMLTALRRRPEERPWGFEVVRRGRFILAEFA